MSYYPHRILLIGGAGYVGNVVAEYLLADGYEITCLDNLLYQQDDSISQFVERDDYRFIGGEFQNAEILDQALKAVTDVVILAGLVGDPITKKYPVLSEEINEKGIRQLFDRLNGRRLRRVVFISTCSNYGLIDSDELADEDHPLRPLSAYSKAKVANEQKLLAMEGDADFQATILRFATAFGLSPRMRFDLTVNEFTRDLALGKELEVYDADTWRPYCHVKDFARLIGLVLSAEDRQLEKKVFNAGGDQNNATKRTIVEAVRNRLPEAKIEFRDNGSDPRNYRVNFQRVRETLGFLPEYSIESGIDEVLEAVKGGEFPEIAAGQPSYGNYEIANAS